MTLEAHVVRFIQLLRVLGIRISTAETIDCLTGLTTLDILDKRQFKTALGGTLVKNREDYQLFQQAFKIYFSSIEQRQQSYSEYREDSKHQQDAIDQAEVELKFKEEALDLTDEEKYLYSQLPEEEKQKIQQFLERSSQGKKVETKFKPVIENVIRGSLDYWKRHLNQELEKLINLDQLGDEELNSYLNKINKVHSKGEVNLVHEDMKNISEHELTKVQVLIKKMSRRLATKISRRYRQSRKVKRADIRRSIRYNMKYGGTLMELKYSTKRLQRPKLLLICDVSGSMARYAHFVIQFIFGLSSAVKNIESFVFAEQVERVTGYFKARQDFAQTMTQIINESKVWGEGTNLTASLGELQDKHRRLLTPNTILIMLSDGKTIAGEEAAMKLHQVGGSVKDIIWLNTLPKESWPGTRTIGQLAKHCRMFQCNTLAHLDTIISKQLFS
ncbi:MAG: VWA domain-containing protein [Clostridia bacterium]|nr:VWA domain-containing protein [Clostridia bacterium]